MATVKLQGIYERRNAIPAAELKPGMVTVWNFGYTETVKSVGLPRAEKASDALLFPTKVEKNTREQCETIDL